MKKSVLLLVLLLITACRGQSDYLETFDEAGNWRIGDDIDASGEVIDGQYVFDVRADSGIFWTTAGENFANGEFSVEVRQTEGPIDAGFGMIFRVDDSIDSFYLFQISADGFVWIGRCLAACAEESILVGDWWFESPTITQGRNETNKLTVQADDNNLIFLVNDKEVGRVTDPVLNSGDIGLFVETLGLGDVQVAFDNFSVSPLSK